MSGTTWSKFFWSDWANDPKLKLCSLAAQGLWMRMLCIAAESDPIGFVTVNGNPLQASEIARLAGCNASEVEHLMAELDRAGVFSRDGRGRIYSRRMTRDARNHALAQKNGKKGGNPNLGKTKENSGLDNPPVKGRLKTHKPEARSQNPPKPPDPQPPDKADKSQTDAARGRAEFAEIEAKARAALGELAPVDVLISPVVAAVRSGVDLDRELLPAIAEVQRAQRAPMRTWRLLVERAMERVNAARNDRRALGVPILGEEPRIDFGGGVRWTRQAVTTAIDRWRADPRTWPREILGPEPDDARTRVPKEFRCEKGQAA